MSIRKVIKRDGREVPVEFDKITRRINSLCHGFQEADLNIEPAFVTQKIISQLSNKMRVSEIDELVAEQCAYMVKYNVDYLTLASRITVSNLHKETPSCFSEAMEIIHRRSLHKQNAHLLSNFSSHQSSSSSSSLSSPPHPQPKTNQSKGDQDDPQPYGNGLVNQPQPQPSTTTVNNKLTPPPPTQSRPLKPLKPFFSEEFINVVRKHSKVLDATINHNDDYKYTYFGVRTLMRSYLKRVDDKIIERPQYLLMRVAVFLNMDDITMALKTYDLFAKRYYTHATPTLCNAGACRSALSSCFLLTIPDDSIEAIYDTLKQCALISKNSGGIGVSVHNIRAAGALIQSSGLPGDGLVPMLKVYNNTAKYVNQGGKRAGAFAIYIEPWHADIFEVLSLKKNTPPEQNRARDLHYGLWIPDLFMKRVIANEKWSLFSEDTAPNLSKVWGDEFETLYHSYEAEGRAVRVIEAKELFDEIVESQIETGEPYMLYKDACNRKSNQKNLGTITSSNLCVAPDTPILTQTGYHQISHLKDKSARVWNGKTWSNVKIQQTSPSSSMCRVHFSDGSFLECTPYHKFYLSDNAEVPAHLLRPGQELSNCIFPSPHEYVMNSIHDLNYAHKEGSECAKKVAVVGALDNANTLVNSIYIPVNATLTNKIKWLQGYFENTEIELIEGLVAVKQMVLKNQPPHVLNQLRLLLHTCDVFPTVNIINNTLLLSVYDISKLVSLGLETNISSSLKSSPSSPSIYEKKTNLKPSILITMVEHDVKVCASYCFNEPNEHRGVFNGILTGNCTEIIEYTSKDEVAVCNLASICLPTFLDKGATNDVYHFNHKKLFDVTCVVVNNLNRAIDLNYYPVPEAEYSNRKNRPIGIGVQGLADVFMMLKLPFESEEARVINKDIFETIYYAAVSASINQAKIHGPYQSYAGSPTSQGILQPDMWGVTPSNRWDWDSLKSSMKLYGIRNSLLVAPMPTASTSQIMGFNEAFEPFTTNLYARKTDSGEFVMVNKYLAKLLTEKGLWDPETIDKLIAHEGSVQFMKNELTPEELNLFKTAYEIQARPIIEMAIDRAPYIDQSQSMNIFMEKPDFKKICKIHKYTYKMGLKTGMYYFRTKASTSAQKITVDPNIIKESEERKHPQEKNSKHHHTTQELLSSSSSSSSSSSTFSHNNSTDKDHHKKRVPHKVEQEQNEQDYEDENNNDSKKRAKNDKTNVCTDEVCFSCGS